MARVEEFLAAVAARAAELPDVRAALLIGSQARTETPADEWSDVDVVLYVDEPARFVSDPSWVEAFGEPVLTLLEQTAVGGQLERRVLYADGLEVDFACFPTAGLPQLLADPEAASVVARGYRVLHDEIGLADALERMRYVPPPRRDPDEIAADFWYHALWTAKKHLRGEHVTARGCLEGSLKSLLLELARESATGDTWHRDRFVERWSDARVVDAMWTSAATPDDVPAVLRRLCDTFEALAAELGLEHPTVRARLEALLP